MTETEKEKIQNKDTKIVLGDAALEIVDAVPFLEGFELALSRYNLTLSPGDCALIECQTPSMASAFFDFCMGLIPASQGSVKCLGLEWSKLSPIKANALRGKIGRTFQIGGWLDLLETEANILWPNLHHTSLPLDLLIRNATALAIKFGMPGLPLLTPNRLSPLDALRSQCIRAFLGYPQVLFFENPISLEHPDFYNSFMDTLSQARQRGVAVVWSSNNPSIWENTGLERCQRFRLDDDGLLPKKEIF
ncbi:ABC transporter ATP-binding protein [Acetobacteraceae bacterium]|nr:ABC transporter ATP-binding protein [Acetobacteraceae bacterium]